MARIETLINKRDNSEIIRDEIAAILATESAQQQTLATAALLDPDDWKLRVFTERSNPWSEFDVDVSPIVNVSFSEATFELSKGNTVEQQRAAGVFHIDCYGYAVSENAVSGHLCGDEQAALEAQRAARLARNILMAGHDTYLGLRGVVGRRWMQSITAFQPVIDGRQVQHVEAVRLALHVDFNEFSPQVQGQTLELVSALVKRKENGQIVVRASIAYPLPQE